MLSERVTKDIARLAARLKTAKEDGQPYSLYVGTEISRSTTGRSFVALLRETVLCDNAGAGLSAMELEALSQEEQEEEFSKTWGQLGSALQRKFLEQAKTALQASPGHACLARLIAQGYFRLIVTSNIDSLLEDSLRQAGAQPKRVISGVHDEQTILTELRSVTSAITMFLLCGELSMGPSKCSVTMQQIEEQGARLTPYITPFVAQELILLGYGFLDDQLLGKLPKAGNVYYIGENLPDGNRQLFFQRYQRPERQDIVAADLSFDLFCQQLTHALGLDVPVPEFEPEPPQRKRPEPPRPAPAPQRREPEPEEPIVIVEPDALVEEIKPAILTVRVDEQKRLSFNVSGKRSFESRRSTEWDVDVEEWNAITTQLGEQRSGDHWRANLKREGRRFYDELFKQQRELTEQFAAARAALSLQELLTLRFVGPRDHLGLPYELLHNENGQPLAAQYPICRQVSGVTPTHSETLDSTIIRLQRERKPFRALLISANTDGRLQVDEEVGALKKLLNNRWQQPPKLEVELLTTATLSAVEKQLDRCKHHLVHFAGHGIFDPYNPEQSGLLLFKGSRWKSRETALLTTRQLGTWLRGSQVRLFFLNCCVAAAAGSRTQLRSNDYLAVTDALVQAGVPYVFGYRWEVSDSGSRDSATHFYTSLLESSFGVFVPEYAAWETRRKLHENSDDTWAVPILVAQPTRS